MQHTPRSRVGLLAALAAPLLSVLLFHPTASQTRPAPAEPALRVTLAAVGDVMMHLPIVASACDPETQGYDFSPMLAPVAPYFRADYTLANLETRLAVPSEKGYTGYPRFNSPPELAAALAGLGINLLATANNHALDMGWDGIGQTLDTLDQHGLAHVGTYRSADERATPFLEDVRGIRIAVLNYTETTNGIRLPKGKEFAVNLLSPEAVAADAKAARGAGADLVVAVLHWGTEYQRAPGAKQREVAKKLLSHGVDVIIGSHPHVVQPIEKLKVTRDGAPYEGYVAYSLGNFLSNQRSRYRDCGLVLYLEIEKTETTTVVRRVHYLPVMVQRRKTDDRFAFRVLPASPTLPAGSDLPLTKEEEARRQQVWQEMTTQLTRPAADIAPLEAPPATELGY